VAITITEVFLQPIAPPVRSFGSPAEPARRMKSRLGAIVTLPPGAASWPTSARPLAREPSPPTPIVPFPVPPT